MSVTALAATAHPATAHARAAIYCAVTAPVDGADIRDGIHVAHTPNKGAMATSTPATMHLWHVRPPVVCRVQHSAHRGARSSVVW